MATKYRAILFDLDGTLLDSVPHIVQCNRETMAAMGISVPEAVIRHSIGLPLPVQAHQFAGERAEEFIVRYRDVYLLHADDDNHLYPGTLEMLRDLKSRNLQLSIVTSRMGRGALKSVEVTGMTGIFRTVVTADDVEHHKPEPEPLLKAINELGVTPEQSLYIGDSAFDVDMSQRAGVDMVGVSWGARTHEEMLLLCPNGVIDNWQQLLDRLS